MTIYLCKMHLLLRCCYCVKIIKNENIMYKHNTESLITNTQNKLDLFPEKDEGNPWILFQPPALGSSMPRCCWHVQVPSRVRHIWGCEEDDVQRCQKLSQHNFNDFSGSDITLQDSHSICAYIANTISQNDKHQARTLQWTSFAASEIWYNTMRKYQIYLSVSSLAPIRQIVNKWPVLFNISKQFSLTNHPWGKRKLEIFNVNHFYFI